MKQHRYTEYNIIKDWSKDGREVKTDMKTGGDAVVVHACFISTHLYHWVKSVIVDHQYIAYEQLRAIITVRVEGPFARLVEVYVSGESSGKVVLEWDFCDPSLHK